MTVMTLLGLEDQRTLKLKRRKSADESCRNRIASPGIHYWTPRRLACKICERPERDGNQENRQYCDWAPLPVLFAFTRKEWEAKQNDHSDDRTDQDNRSFERWWKQRQEGIHPKKEKVRPGCGLYNPRVGLAGRTEWPEIEGTRCDGEENYPRKDRIFPDAIGHKRHPLRTCRGLVLF